eukprot:Gb_09200 [translate_table: standard]
MKKVVWSMGKGSAPKDRSVSRESYYPDCRKDAQCNCNMCMASIHATLDLRPSNNLFSSITNWSESPSRSFMSPPPPTGKDNQWPNSEFSKNKPSTPPRKELKRARSSALDSTAKSAPKLFEAEPVDELVVAEKNNNEKKKKKKKKQKREFLGKILVIFCVLFLEFVVPWCLSGHFKPYFTADKVKGIAEESMSRMRLADRLDFVARKMARVVPGQVINCTGSDSTWKLEQDGLLVHSHCILYSSIVEEVSLWGCPTQTAGVIGRGIVDRSLTIMSGQMIEWYEGKTDYAVHREGNSWTHAKWTASVVQMDGRTWILEYRPSAILQGGGLVSRALHFLNWLICRILEKVRLNFRSFLLPKLNVPHVHGDYTAPT